MMRAPAGRGLVAVGNAAGQVQLADPRAGNHPDSELYPCDMRLICSALNAIRVFLLRPEVLAVLLKGSGVSCVLLARMPVVPTLSEMWPSYIGLAACGVGFKHAETVMLTASRDTDLTSTAT